MGSQLGPPFFLAPLFISDYNFLYDFSVLRLLFKYILLF